MKRKFLALALSAAMVAGFAAPSFADGEKVYDWKVNQHDIEADSLGNSTEEVEYQELKDNPKEAQSADVYAIVGSTYTVTIPKVIVLSGKDKTATYRVDVDGDIAGVEYVQVAPADSVTMKQAGKADVTGTITQAITKFYASNNNSEITAADSMKMSANNDDSVTPKDATETEAAVEASETTGSISAQDLTAGKWAGTFNFDIKLVNTEAPATDAPANADGQ